MTDFLKVNVGEGDCFLYQNCLKILNLESDFRCELHEMTNFGIFTNFWSKISTSLHKPYQKLMMSSSVQLETPAK